MSVGGKKLSVCQNNVAAFSCCCNVANHFNSFFTSIAKELVNKLGNTSKKFADYLNNPLRSSMFLNPVTELEVSDQISNLNVKKSADAYDIPAKLIKMIKTQIIRPLTELINISFTTGYCPDLLKFAKVIPIYKTNSPLDVKKYRPISMLPIFNKIMEKLVYSRIIKFLKKNDVIFNYQFGFQKNKSPSLAILDMKSKTIEANEKKAFLLLYIFRFRKSV